MKVSAAVDSRISCRAFLDKEPPAETIRALITAAARAPSGGNLQPWHLHVLRGAPLKTLVDDVRGKIAAGTRGEGSDYDVYPRDLMEPYKARRSHVGEMLYSLLEIPRENKVGRLEQFANNYRLFGAPVGIFFSLHRAMGPPQWSDVGMFMQNLMLLAREEGLHTCPQECWSGFTPSVRRALALDEDYIFFCGLALGYMDESAPINRLKTERAPLSDIATFMGFND